MGCSHIAWKFFQSQLRLGISESFVFMLKACENIQNFKNYWIMPRLPRPFCRACILSTYLSPRHPKKSLGQSSESLVRRLLCKAKLSYVYLILKPHDQSSRSPVRLLLWKPSYIYTILTLKRVGGPSGPPAGIRLLFLNGQRY